MDPNMLEGILAATFFLAFVTTLKRMLFGKGPVFQRGREDLKADQLAELEERIRSELAQHNEEVLDRLEYLEDRLEFAERILSEDQFKRLPGEKEPTPV